MVKRSTSAEPQVTVKLTPALRRALERMAADTVRSVPNLARKILADHLRNGGYLSEDEERAIRLENVCVKMRPREEAR